MHIGGCAWGHGVHNDEKTSEKCNLLLRPQASSRVGDLDPKNLRPDQK